MNRILKLIPALMVGLCVAGPTWAQTVEPVATPTGNLPFTPAAVFSVVDYGARCDWNGSTGTNDTTAINNAVAAWKTAGASGGAILVGPGRGQKCLVTGPINFTGTVNSAFSQVVDGLYLYGKFSANGPVGTLGAITAGTGGTPGTYTNVPLTGGTGSTCTASSVVVGGGGGVTSIVLPAGGCGTGYAIGDSLSALSANIGSTTGFSVIVGTTSGGAIIDAMGSRYVDFENVTVEGDCTTIPNAGIAIGRYQSAVSADNFKFSYPTIRGCFAFAGFYNLASEILLADHFQLYWNNTSNTSNQFGLVQDGGNHWNWSSTFTTVTTPVDTAQSFNQDIFLRAVINVSASTTAVPIWMEQTSHHEFISTYLAGKAYGVYLYSSGSTMVNLRSSFDVHFETTGLTNNFFVTGANATPTFNGFYYQDHNDFASNAIFVEDTNITTATLKNADIRVSNFAAGTPLLFNNNALWTAGFNRVELPATGNWTVPNVFNGGTICLVSTCVVYSAGAVTPAAQAGVVSFGGTTLPTLGANGEGAIVSSSTLGLALKGQGSADDMVLQNSAGSTIMSVATGTVAAVFPGNVSAGRFQVTSNNNPGTGIFLPATATLGLSGGVTLMQTVAANAVTWYNLPTSGTITYAMCAAAGANGAGGGAMILDTSATICGLSSMLFKEGIAAFDRKGQVRLASLTPKGYEQHLSDHLANVDPIAIAMKLVPAEFRGDGITIADTSEQFGFMAQDTCDADERLCARFQDGSPRTFKPNAVLALAIAVLQKQQACLDDWKCRIFGVH